MSASAIGFAYDAVGDQTQRTLPNSIAVNYGYDSLERLTSVSAQQGTTLATYTLNGAGNRTRVANADGSSTIWTYDKAFSRLHIGQAWA